MNAILPRSWTRSTASIYADIESQLKLVMQIRILAADFYSCDTRPLVYDGTSVQRIGDALPKELRDNLALETDRLRQLHDELYEATLIEHRRRST